ncbi:MAG TPA: hypothetical protein VGW38_14685 [Chloroflexota bacterium]|nr:hypothetical protein [Chloroflexota bacterium]
MPAANASHTRLSHRSCYRVMGFRCQVASNAPEFIATLDRLNAHFLDTAPEPGDAIYEAVSHDGGNLWEITFQDEDLCFRESLVRAASHVEWHICEQAIAGRQDLLHVHGAALAGRDASVLLPGRSGIGKTTFALAAALRGLRLLSDDVVFLDTQTWQPASFARAFHIHNDALPRLTPLGLRYAPEDHIGHHLCSTVFDPWDHAPGPPLRYVVFPRFDAAGPLQLEPMTQAEATVELMRYSKNLRRFPRFGLDLIPRLLEQVDCYILRRNDDLAAAADLLRSLIAT